MNSVKLFKLHQLNKSRKNNNVQKGLFMKGRVEQKGIDDNE